MDVISLKINKILTMFIVLCITSIVCATSAFADYTITVPQSVALTSPITGTGTYSGTVSVKIAGSIGDDEQLCISAPSTMTMSNGYTDVDATINTDSKTVWSKSEVSAGQAQNDYNISANLTPGTWTGTETFYVRVGKTYNITVGDNSVSLIASDEDISHLKFESNDDSVASVDSAGHLIGNKAGTAKIIKAAYDSTNNKILYTTTYIVNVKRNNLTVVYDANGSTFSNSAKQNTVVYGPLTETDVIKTSKTSNVSDDGATYSGGYGNNQAITDTITIPGAKQLMVTITYATEGTRYDWVCVYDKTVTPSASNYASSVSGKLGDRTKTTKTYTINGDTVQFFFRSDSSSDSYFGYYATIEGTGMTRPCLSGSCEEPSKIASGMHFEGWYMDSKCTNGNEFDLTNVPDSVNTITVYAKWEEDVIAKGVTGGVSWKLYPTGLLRIYPTNGISGTMDNAVSYSGFEWHKYSSSIKSVIVDSGVFTNQNISYMFSDCSNLKNIDIKNLNTVNATNMSYMFYRCSGLSSINVNSFDTRKVTDMSNMFSYCSALSTVYINSFDTSKVTDMHDMFSYCSSLTTLNLKNFNTSNVTSMRNMFFACAKLSSLDVSSFNTSHVTRMDYMFHCCSNLSTINISNFDTSKVTDMRSMFNYCSSLTTLDLKKFNTSNVTNMNSMFNNCRSLPTINVSNFNTINVTDMGYMFNDCWAVTTLDVKNFNTSKVTNMACMFNGCNKPAVIDVSNFNTSKVTNMRQMFSGCYGITALNLSKFNTSNVTDMGKMFYFCYSIKELNLQNFNTNKVTNYTGIMGECWSLRILKVNNTFASSNLPSSGKNGTEETGILYIPESTAKTLSGNSTLPITIYGNISTALKSYNFTGDYRTVTFIATTQNDIEEGPVISDDIKADETEIVPPISDIFENETVNEPKAPVNSAENPISNDSTKDETSEVDESSDEGQDDSQITDEEAGSDTDYSEVDSNASADTNSTDDGESSDSTIEPNSDDLYYPDSAAA